jgi:hypothetical protein
MKETFTKAQEAELDEWMVEYLKRKSCTPWHSIACHFELHETELLDASLERLAESGRALYDERRGGWSTCAPPYHVDRPPPHLSPTKGATHNGNQE